MKPQAPPRVDPHAYWTSPPPEPSARCVWWQDRIRAGWRRNRRIASLGYSEAADHFGVYLWEWLEVLGPMLREVEEAAVTA
jgi:hypothetical protein